MRTAATITTFLLVTSVSPSESNDRLFTGEIMDSPCAAMGTHDRMMKGLQAKDARDCSQKCVRMVGKYVLYDPAKKATYQIDDQQKSAAYAGQKVAVKGTYDTATKTIHVESIGSQ